MGTAPVVCLAVIDDMPMFEVAVACEVFGTDRADLVDPWYELRLCAANPDMTRVPSGFVLRSEYGLEALETGDMVIVPALPNRYVRSDAELDPRLLNALRAAHANGARLVSLCTGAFALAAAGLLDGRRATTHWMHAAALAARYPAVQVDPAGLYIDDGDVLTSGGRSAGIDLCLHLVRMDLGAEIANQLARRMVVQAHRPGGQAQYIEATPPQNTTSSTDDDMVLSRALEWAVSHMDRQLTIADIAGYAGMSSRTLIRRFHTATGTTPLRWLYGRRIARARELLEATDLPISRIGELCGLGSAGNLRHHFIRSVGVTPTEYRRAFHEGKEPAGHRRPAGRHGPSDDR